ncbi:DinB family protein [Ulvibacterium marinum]|uniref:DinB family protein n=1 Tax=Ulvibacterium marinum TaxID=2419782 RepID=A0A3B0CAK2_9FLAO|nr:DinB family protein [Ulvibacterium marinum]RKN80979.1 DinB family protein [Ulvibacterium marinum]
MKTSEIQLPDGDVFYKTYIDVLGEVELMDFLQKQLENFPQFINSIPDSKWQHAYEEQKWTVAEVLLHIIDAERVFQYRALRFARGDGTALPGFDQDEYVKLSGANRRSKESLIEEYRAVRRASIALFTSLDRQRLTASGTASGMSWSVAALGFVICGHQKHHRNILRERYL